jgi:hypothetical protein
MIRVTRCSVRRAVFLALITILVVLASCGFVRVPGGTPQPAAATVLTDQDLARRVVATKAGLRSSPEKVVHPLFSDELQSVMFVSESSPPCIDLQYAFAALSESGPLYIKSPVRGTMVWLDGHPGLSYTFELVPPGADYFVWLNVSLGGAGSTPELSLAANVQAGAAYERGAALAICSYRSPDLHLSMGVARCKDPKTLGSVRCELADGRAYLDLRQSSFWLQGYPQFLPH